MRTFLRRDPGSLVHEVLLFAATQRGDYCPCCRLRLPGDVGYENGAPSAITRSGALKISRGNHRHAVSCPRVLGVQ